MNEKIIMIYTYSALIKVELNLNRSDHVGTYLHRDY